MELLKVGDWIQGLQVTRVSDNFCFFGNKRLSWAKINTLILKGERVQFNVSPDIELDWTSKETILEFHNSFKRWSFYLSGGCKYETACVEVKDGLAYYKGIYYLPFGGTYKDYCAKENLFPKDGWYYSRLFKRGFGYYNTMDSNHFAYVYTVENKEPYTKEEVDRIDYRNNYKFNILEEDIEHIKSLDLRSINSKELDFIKSNMAILFKDLLPYKAKNNVTIHKWFMNSPLQCTKGLLYIDNGYKGHNINKMDYYVMLKYHPSFSNEMNYGAQFYIKDFSINSFNGIATEIEKSIKSFAQI